MITKKSIKPSQFLCCVLIGLLLMPPSVYANDLTGAREKLHEVQDFTVTGQVTSNTDGFPIPGATVREKGTTNGAVTDFDGNFKLTLSSASAVLEYSYIAFKAQEITVDVQSSINAVLAEDVQALEEVVVVGYGTKKKLNLT